MDNPQTEALRAEMKMWRSRAYQNLAELRRLHDSLSHTKRELRRARREAAKYRIKAKAEQTDRSSHDQEH